MGILVLIAGGVVLATDCGRGIELEISANHESLQAGDLITYTISIDWLAEGTVNPRDDEKETTLIVTLDSRLRFDDPLAVAQTQVAQNDDGSDDSGFTRLDARWSVDPRNDAGQVVITTVVVPPEGGILELRAIVRGGPLGTDPLITRVQVDTDANLHGDDRDEAFTEIVDLGLATEQTDPAPGEEVAPGDTITYTHTLTNAGVVAAQTGLNMVVPAGTTFVALGSDSLWSCADGDPAGTDCTRPVTLQAGSLGTAQLSLTIPFVVRINDDHPTDTPVVLDSGLPFVSTVGSRTAGDPNPTNNLAVEGPMPDTFHGKLPKQ